ncbi:hypothetical protein OAF82_00590 [bacterium]|nr:hypothetical protein [bacterium]
MARPQGGPQVKPRHSIDAYRTTFERDTQRRGEVGPIHQEIEDLWKDDQDSYFRWWLHARLLAQSMARDDSPVGDEVRSWENTELDFSAEPMDRALAREEQMLDEHDLPNPPPSNPYRGWPIGTIVEGAAEFQLNHELLLRESPRLVLRHLLRRLENIEDDDPAKPFLDSITSYLETFRDLVDKAVTLNITGQGTAEEKENNFGKKTGIARYKNLAKYLRRFEGHADDLAATALAVALDQCIEQQLRIRDEENGDAETSTFFSTAALAEIMGDRLADTCDRLGIETEFVPDRDRDAPDADHIERRRKIEIGASVLRTMAADHCDLFTLEEVSTGSKATDNAMSISLTEKGIKAIQTVQELAKLPKGLASIPQLVKARPYIEGQAGSWTKPAPVIRPLLFNEHDTVHRGELPPLVASAFNRYQAERYCLDWSMIDLARSLLREGLVWKKGDKGLLTREDFEDERKRKKEANPEKDPDPYRNKLEASTQVVESLEWYQKQAQLALERGAKQVHDAFFPMYLDWRGRLYYRPRFSPQGDTLAKGAIKLGEPEYLLDETSETPWVKGRDAIRFVLGSLNTGKTGLDGGTPGETEEGTETDKAELEDQVAWAKKHESILIQVGKEPNKHREVWANTDSPFEFLAACKEIGSDLSHSPVRIDAVCSGVQHMATLARDSVIGEYVYLRKGDKRLEADLYKLIALEATEALQRHDDERVRKALEDRGNELGRGECKPVGMQYGYNVGKLTIAGRLVEDFGWPMLDLGTEGNPKDSLAYQVAEAQFNVIDFHGQGVRGVKRWLQHVAALVTMNGRLPFEWVNRATDFRFVQRYAQTKTEGVMKYAGDYGLTWRSEMKPGEKGRRDNPAQLREDTVNGIAANVVHQLDSALLVLLADEMPDHLPLTVIHDSAGTHANELDELHRAVRRAHVRLYKYDHLVDIYDQTLEQLKQSGEKDQHGTPLHKLLQHPYTGHETSGAMSFTKGNLEPKDVLESRYFWS